MQPTDAQRPSARVSTMRTHLVAARDCLARVDALVRDPHPTTDSLLCRIGDPIVSYVSLDTTQPLPQLLLRCRRSAYLAWTPEDRLTLSRLLATVQRTPILAGT